MSYAILSRRSATGWTSYARLRGVRTRKRSATSYGPTTLASRALGRRSLGYVEGKPGQDRARKARIVDQRHPQDRGRSEQPAHRCGPPRTRARSAGSASLPGRGSYATLHRSSATFLNNAAKYTPEGGKIILSAQLEGNEVVITVSDNGVGIPSDMLPQVFDLFTQVAADNLHRSRGKLGIGLALVKQLVEMHGGRGDRSPTAPGRVKAALSGCACLWRIPALASSSVAEPRSPHSPQKATLKVLVVDDNFRRRSDRWLGCSRQLAMTIGWFMKVSSRFRRHRNTAPTRSCSTLACPAWTATQSVAALREHRGSSTIR